MTVENQEIDDGLTDQERAALADEGGEPTNTPAEGHDDAAAAEEAAAAEAAEKEAADKAAADAAAAAAASGSEPPAGETPPEDDGSENQPQSAPILIAPASEDTATKLADIEAKKDALLEQFDNGDVTAKEYQKQLDTLSREERAIEFRQFEAGIAQKMESQRLQNDWTATCNAFVESNGVYKDNPRLYKALDAEVRDLAAKPETANWSGQKFLDEAHKNLQKAFGFADQGKPAVAGVKHKTPRPDLPPNLAKVPAADVEDTNGGRFAVLDRMAENDPVGYEETLAKMPQAERDAYLNA